MLYIRTLIKYLKGELPRNIYNPISFDLINNIHNHNNLLIIPIEEYGCLIHEDTHAQFDIWTYCYNNDEKKPPKLYLKNNKICKHLSFKTEFYGDSLKNITNEVVKHKKYTRILLLNGDVMTTISQLNRCFFIASVHQLDIFQPSLALDSFYSHDHLLNKPGCTIEEVKHTEVMMLGLSRRVWKELAEYSLFNKSGWGIDSILLPALAKKNDWVKPCVIHASIARHCKPVESGEIIFSNGKSSAEELNELTEVIENENFY